MYRALMRAGTELATHAYSGSKFTDPIDGRSYRRFLPHGGSFGRRNDALCPGTLSLERHRLLWLFLERETNFFTERRRVLHIAPEPCFYWRFRRMKNLDYVTGDLGSPLADVDLDLHHLPFRDGDFDVIICNHVLEHVDDDGRCMRELRRVLEPCGFAIINVPIHPTSAITLEDRSVTEPEERARLYGQDNHVRYYGADYADRLRAAGFDVKVERYAEELSSEELERFRIVTDEVIFVATVPQR